MSQSPSHLDANEQPDGRCSLSSPAEISTNTSAEFDTDNEESLSEYTIISELNFILFSLC